MEKLTFLSKAPGVGGKLKQSAEDFLVEEIALDGSLLELEKPFPGKSREGKFTHFALQKKNWNTTQALHAIADRLGVSRKRFSFAGTKDRVAVSTQMCSAFEVPPEKLLALQVKDLQILGAWTEKEKVRMGGLLGNRFRITARGAGDGAAGKAQAIYGELGGVFPNYFGEQRFGSIRKNTALVGKAIVRNDLKDAVWEYLCGTDGNEAYEAGRARRELRDAQDFGKALSYFPRHLKYERTLIGRLAGNPKDYAGALRSLPRQLLLMFVHAFQSQLFNESLSQRIGDGRLRKEGGEYYCGTEKTWGFPDLEKKAVKGFLAGKIVGFDSKPNEREKKLLKQEEIRLEDFKVKSLPEAGSAGSLRALLAPLKKFAAEEKNGALEFSFALPAGSYATAALREFLEEEK